MEKKEKQKSEREGKVIQERQGKEEEDRKKNGKTLEEKEAGRSQSTPKIKAISNMKTWYRGRQREKITEAISKTYEKECTIQHSGKKVYLYTLTTYFLQVSLASWSYHVNN